MQNLRKQRLLSWNATRTIRIAVAMLAKITLSHHRWPLFSLSHASAATMSSIDIFALVAITRNRRLSRQWLCKLLSIALPSKLLIKRGNISYYVKSSPQICGAETLTSHRQDSITAAWQATGNLMLARKWYCLAQSLRTHKISSMR